MRWFFSALVLAAFTLPCHAQRVVEPGHPSIEPALIAPGSASMAYLVFVDNAWVEVGSFETDLSVKGAELHASTVMSFLERPERLEGHQVMEAETLRPIRNDSDISSGHLRLSFGDRVTGEFATAEGDVIAVDEDLPGSLFDFQTYSYVIRALPLRLGYRAVIPVYAFAGRLGGSLDQVLVDGVESGRYTSEMTGDHAVWRVRAQETSGARFEYQVDKDSRRLWQVDITAPDGTTKIRMIDREADFQPYRNTLDQETIRAMLNDGTSTIKGRAYARLMPSYNGRRNAERGERVVLIPDTPFFREWLDVNERRVADGLVPLSLPPGAEELIRFTEVYDDKGSFEFTHLQPGDYTLRTYIQYRYGYNVTVETGRAAVYYNNAYQGDLVSYGSAREVGYGEAAPEAKVSIARDGQTVKVRLVEWKWKW